MRQEKQGQKSTDSSLEAAISKLQGLSNESRAAIASLINRLADAEGVSFGLNHKLPNENISHWLTKLAPFSSSTGIGGAGEGGVSLSQVPNSRRGVPSNREAR